MNLFNTTSALNEAHEELRALGWSPTVDNCLALAKIKSDQWIAQGVESKLEVIVTTMKLQLSIGH